MAGLDPYAAPAAEIVVAPTPINLEAATRYYAWLKWTGLVMLLALIAVIGIGVTASTPHWAISAVLVYGGFMVAPLVFLVATVQFARAVEKSAMVWGLLSFFFYPLSMIVVIVKARSTLQAARAGQGSAR